MNKSIFSIIFLLISSVSHAASLDLIRPKVEGCYIGTDQRGNSVYGEVKYIYDPIGEDNITIAQDGIASKYLTVQFYNSSDETKLVTQIFENGKFVSTELVNKSVSYSHTGTIQKFLSGTEILRTENNTEMVIKFLRDQVVFDIYQNNNSEFFPEIYMGGWKSGFAQYTVSPISCKTGSGQVKVK